MLESEFSSTFDEMVKVYELFLQYKTQQAAPLDLENIASLFEFSTLVSQKNEDLGKRAMCECLKLTLLYERQMNGNPDANAIRLLNQI